MKVISEALRLIRVFHDLKQKDLADRLGISKSHLSEVESGKKQPRVELIERYSSEFGIPPSSILFFAESLKNPGESAAAVEKARGVIAHKVLNFLQLIEYRTGGA
jgi:transcriptional regulator with XRE-family HTH domain